MFGGRVPSKTALHDAAERGDLDRLKAEIAAGADIEARNQGFRETALHKASIKGHAPIVRELLEANADIQAARSGGFTPLHMAETREVAKLLLDHGADPTARSSVRSLHPPTAIASTRAGVALSRRVSPPPYLYRLPARSPHRDREGGLRAAGGQDAV